VYYSIIHTTAYRYSEPIRESVMELRMRPRDEMSARGSIQGGQQCFSFNVRLDPKADLGSYKDYLGNTVHTFNIPGSHDRLTVIAESLVETHMPATVPLSLPESAWDELEAMTGSAELYDMLLPGHFTEMTPLLRAYMTTQNLTRCADPLATVWMINHFIHEHFEYTPKATQVDSPIDHLLETGKGVCQDYAHTMLAILRYLGIPARYVSGYLYHRRNDNVRISEQDATHAWVDVWMPSLGWVGFDPTNDTAATDRHIRVALGRDYYDVPPTRGVYKGTAATRLEYGVIAHQLDALPMNEPSFSPAQMELDLSDAPFIPPPAPISAPGISIAQQIAQQQQQQQQ